MDVLVEALLILLLILNVIILIVFLRMFKCHSRLPSIEHLGDPDRVPLGQRRFRKLAKCPQLAF